MGHSGYAYVVYNTCNIRVTRCVDHTENNLKVPRGLIYLYPSYRFRCSGNGLRGRVGGVVRACLDGRCYS